MSIELCFGYAISVDSSPVGFEEPIRLLANPLSRSLSMFNSSDLSVSLTGLFCLTLPAKAAIFVLRLSHGILCRSCEEDSPSKCAIASRKIFLGFGIDGPLRLFPGRASKEWSHLDRGSRSNAM
jgi:hypothetical protein